MSADYTDEFVDGTKLVVLAGKVTVRLVAPGQFPVDIVFEGGALTRLTKACMDAQGMKYEVLRVRGLAPESKS